MSEINEANKSLLSSLEKRGLLEMTKAYFRTNLIESLKKDDFYKTAPSGFNNINQQIIKDPKTISILRLQYSLINDFLIRTKMTYTQNILSNEIKSLMENNIPLTDTEIIRTLNLNSKQISNSRLNSSLKSGPNDLIKNTYLYHLINLHSNLTKIDGEAQTLFYDEKNQKSNKAIDLEKELRKIDEKYNKMIDINKVIPFSKLNEKKFLEYKEECDNKYKEDLKSEMERFKNIEISQMRLDENKNYITKIEKIREEYEQIYEKKNEEIQKMKQLLEEKEKMLEKQQDQKTLENNEIILSQLKKIRDDSEQRINEYINEINKINNEKNLLEQTIENMKEKFDLDLKSQIAKIKNNYMEQLATEKSLLKEESEREKKIMINNYTNKAYRKESLEENKNNTNANININNNSIYLKNSNLNKKIAEDFHNRRKRLEEIDEEQERFNNRMKYEFNEIINEHVPLVLLNQEEIDQIKNNNEYINNALLNEKKENQRKKSQNENWNNNININNINNAKEIKSPLRNNNTLLNNNKNLVINNQIRSNNMGIPSANIFNNVNLNSTNKKSSGVIEENLDFENISSSQKSKELSNKKSGTIAMNNINTSNFGSNKKSIFPPINNNMSYSIKEEINISANKTKSRIGSSGKKNLENNNNFINNKSNKKNNEEDDDYGEGDFENNISSFNQASDKKQIKFGKIKNQNEKISNKEEVEESYNDFDNTKGLINKGVNFEGSSGFYNNNVSKFNNNMNINNKKNNDESEIKEDIEYDSNNDF